MSLRQREANSFSLYTWGDNTTAALADFYLWSLLPCGSVPASRDPLHCGPECTSTCHITTVCKGDCHKNWSIFGVSWLQSKERKPNHLRLDPRTWTEWEMEFRTRLRMICPSMIAVVRGDETFADFHAKTIAPLSPYDARNKAEDFGEMEKWLGFSVLVGGDPDPVFETFRFYERDQVSGPIWDALYTFHAKSVLRLYWNLYHFNHLDDRAPVEQGLRQSVKEAARTLLFPLPVDFVPCRCHKCRPELWTALST
ncbi:hypothetical protein QBC39DRAFT_349722 [Podospora conica]|nr:hypothetical protein QBC39DRAFT_349722 [Schizothecium conicum]